MLITSSHIHFRSRGGHQQNVFRRKTVGAYRIRPDVSELETYATNIPTSRIWHFTRLPGVDYIVPYSFSLTWRAYAIRPYIVTNNLMNHLSCTMMVYMACKLKLQGWNPVYMTCKLKFPRGNCRYMACKLKSPAGNCRYMACKLKSPAGNSALQVV